MTSLEFKITLQYITPAIRKFLYFIWKQPCFKLGSAMLVFSYVCTFQQVYVSGCFASLFSPFDFFKDAFTKKEIKT